MTLTGISNAGLQTPVTHVVPWDPRGGSGVSAGVSWAVGAALWDAWSEEVAAAKPDEVRDAPGSSVENPIVCETIAEARRHIDAAIAGSIVAGERVPLVPFTTFTAPLTDEDRKWLAGKSLRRVCFPEGVDLVGADLKDTDLRDADLTGAKLRNADLKNAALIGAKLYGAKLRNAALINADLAGADLRNADLRDADLRNANVWATNTTGVQIREARSLEDMGAIRRNPMVEQNNRLLRAALKGQGYSLEEIEAIARWEEE